MKIFKFGGASVKSAKAVKNIAEIIRSVQNEKLIVVVSAMGKTTNEMEKILTSLYSNNNLYLDIIEQVKQYHFEIINKLNIRNKSIYLEINSIFDQIIEKKRIGLTDNFPYEYDQIVSLGEVISTKIINSFLIDQNIDSIWLDARKLIRTNSNYQQAKVNWNKTSDLVTFEINKFNHQYYVTQGFIGHNKEGFTTTLGREGSDFSASILAYVTQAKDVTIWKDVPGMLNADPKWFKNTVKLDKISFHEALELSYYGASVIHPKTIKPLQNKNIPLYVKSFFNPREKGTVIQKSTNYDAMVASFIFKLNQILISFSPKDFSFIMENSLGELFFYFGAKNYKINLMQNSALNFSVCMDFEKININQILDDLSNKFNIKYNDNLELVTIRHFDEKTIDRVSKNKIILLQQKTRQTARFVLKKN